MEIQNKLLAGQTVIVGEEVDKSGKIKFNEKGIAMVSEEGGNFLLNLPGYSKCKPPTLFPVKKEPETTQQAEAVMPEEVANEPVEEIQTETEEPKEAEEVVGEKAKKSSKGK